jgi:hypothetical protein
MKGIRKELLTEAHYLSLRLEDEMQEWWREVLENRIRTLRKASKAPIQREYLEEILYDESWSRA